MILSRYSRGDSAMFPLSRDFLMFAVACAILVLAAAAHSRYVETVAAWGF
jgi:hypothetical protein